MRTIAIVWLILLVVGVGWSRIPSNQPNHLQILESEWCPVALTYRTIPEGRNRETLDPRHIAELTERIVELFGPPESPRLLETNTEVRAVASESAALFRANCAHCHGITGDGAGPISRTLSPYPRDFRMGIFKYTTTDVGYKPIRGDLRQTLRRGVPGTAMPRFRSLSDEQIDQLLDEVIFLTVRGEVESELARRVYDAGDYVPERREILESHLRPILATWQEAVFGVVPVDLSLWTAASEERGRQIYIENRYQCVTCHGERGDGNGSQRDKVWDDWSLAKRAHNAERQAELDRLYLLPARRLRPRDFRLGEYRFGDDWPAMFRCIAVGIKGTPMPAAHRVGDIPAILTDQQIVDVTRYIRSLASRFAAD